MQHQEDLGQRLLAMALEGRSQRLTIFLESLLKDRAGKNCARASKG